MNPSPCSLAGAILTLTAVSASAQWLNVPAMRAITVSRWPRVSRTRAPSDSSGPLCPYPQVARYQGSGSIDDAANFACRMP